MKVVDPRRSMWAFSQPTLGLAPVGMALGTKHRPPFGVGTCPKAGCVSALPSRCFWVPSSGFLALRPNVLGREAETSSLR